VLYVEEPEGDAVGAICSPEELAELQLRLNRKGCRERSLLESLKALGQELQDGRWLAVTWSTARHMEHCTSHGALHIIGSTARHLEHCTS
jgi:hypothetical protein